MRVYREETAAEQNGLLARVGPREHLWILLRQLDHLVGECEVCCKQRTIWPSAENEGSSQKSQVAATHPDSRPCSDCDDTCAWRASVACLSRGRNNETDLVNSLISFVSTTFPITSTNVSDSTDSCSRVPQTARSVPAVPCFTVVCQECETHAREFDRNLHAVRSLEDSQIRVELRACTDPRESVSQTAMKCNDYS